jgi:tetratricopeptide (TPR) repeat protein
MADDRMFKEALVAIERGQRDRARDLLTRLLREDQKKSDYWLYMSAVVETEKERIYCLENVLKIDPKNKAAQRGLVMIGARPPDPNLKPVRPHREREVELEEMLSLSQERAKPLAQIPIAQLGLFGAIGIVAVALILFGIFGNPFARDTTPGYIAPEEIGASLDTSTPTSTGVGPDGAQVTPTFEGPTPLALFLEVTYTPTPRTVDTPHPSSEAYSSGLRSFDEGEWREAIERLEQHLESTPEDVDVRYYIGMAYFNLAEYRDAEQAFNKAINIDKEFGPAYWGRAITRLERDPERAVGDDLTKAISYAPDFVEAYITRSEYFVLRDNLEAAQDDVDMIFELSPDDARGHYVQAKIYLAQEMYEEALESAEMSSQLDITYYKNHLVWGIALVETGNLEEAIGPLQTYLTFEDSNAEAWFYLGRAQQGSGYHENALLIFDHADSLREDYFEIDYYRGLSKMALGETEEALDLFKNAARIFPRWFEPKLYLGIAYLEDDQAGNAYTTINTSSALAETDEQLAMLYYWRALSLEALGDNKSAKADWERLLELPSTALTSEMYATAELHLQGIDFTATPTSRTPSRTPTPTKTKTPTPTPSPTP